MATRTFRIWRGEEGGEGRFADYTTDITEGMVVLDAVHQIQAESAGDLAVRWNCKAGKCGSCSAEVNGNPRLMCMTRMSDLPEDRPVTIEPMRTFPLLKDLVTDVSWNFEVKKRIKKFKPRAPTPKTGPGAWTSGTWTGCRSSGSASSASSARTSVTSSATPTSTTSSSVPGSSSTPPPSRCIRWTPKTGSRS